jgi:hypothetical protein
LIPERLRNFLKVAGIKAVPPIKIHSASPGYGGNHKFTLCRRYRVFTAFPRVTRHFIEEQSAITIAGPITPDPE